jgi:hypothetical protein
MTIESYPLHWPAGWPRSTWSQRGKSRFNGQTVSQIKELQRELRLLGARNVVISSNVPVRQDGLPYADAAKRRYDDPGVAVYFTLKGKPLAMARDRYWTPLGRICGRWSWQSRPSDPSSVTAARP